MAFATSFLRKDSQMNEFSAPRDDIELIVAKGSISAEDVEKVREVLFKDGINDRSGAESMFWLDQACATKDPAWKEFYVDSLTDYFIWKAEPAKHISPEDAQFLLDHVVKDGRVDGDTELELLVNIVHWADSCPESMALFVMEAVRDSILDPNAGAYGKERRPNVIDAVDVEILAMVIHARAGAGGFNVTREEAELLFELNNATIEAENHESWRELFVEAVSNYLMFPNGAPVVRDAEESRRRDLWLENRRTVGTLLLGVGRALGRLEIADMWKEADVLGAGKRARTQRAINRARVDIAREEIAEPQVKWLIEHIGEDDVLHETERALLMFLRDTSPNIHPLMDDLFAMAGI